MIPIDLNQAVVWRFLAHFLRRHNAHPLSLLELQPSGGMQRCLAVYSSKGEFYRQRLFHINVRNAYLTIHARLTNKGKDEELDACERGERGERELIPLYLAGEDGVFETLDEDHYEHKRELVAKLVGLPRKPRGRHVGWGEEPASVFEIISAFVNRWALAAEDVFVSNGWIDSSGYGGSGADDGLKIFPELWAQIEEQNDDWKAQCKLASEVWIVRYKDRAVYLHLDGRIRSGQSARKWNAYSPVHNMSADEAVTIIEDELLLGKRPRPVIEDLSACTKIEILDSWGGMGVGHASEWKLEWDGERFCGKGEFRVGSNEHLLKEVIEVSMSKKVVAGFLKKLQAVRLVEGEYEPYMDHTDDYPYMGIRLTLPDGEVLFKSESQRWVTQYNDDALDEAMQPPVKDSHGVPWGYRSDLGEFTANDPGPSLAIESLRRHLKPGTIRRVLSKWKKKHGSFY